MWLTQGKRVLLSAAMALLVLAAIEGISYFGLRVVDGKTGLRPILSYLPKNADPRTLYERLMIGRKRCDVELGWETAEVVRGGQEIPSGQKGFVSAYGDSFTYCSEVEYEQSWEYLLQQKVGREFLNLGVEGYGTDQAYLKFARSYSKYPTEYAILAILPDDINRLLLVIPSYRWKIPPITKPRFQIVDGEVRFLRNPITDLQDYLRLLDPKFLSEISQNDECYRYHRDHYGFWCMEDRFHTRSA